MQTAKVRMRKPQRVYSLLCDDVTLARDEACVVRTDRGIELGVCVLPPEPCSQDMASRYSMRVIRKMTEEDVKTRDHLTKEEEQARALCQKKIKSRNMPMKLVDVEYTFDKHKIVFYFTADDRVDFREIVRDLAHELRSRIEMRHIQVRDEAKVVGGIGSCGRQLCCTTFLNEFKPISMRMAKRQNLSLNPSKISGQCGRLLCCLSYENDQYENMKRRAKPAPSDKAPEKDERDQSRDRGESKRREQSRDRNDAKDRQQPRDRDQSKGRSKGGGDRSTSDPRSRDRDHAEVKKAARAEKPAPVERPPSEPAVKVDPKVPPTEPVVKVEAVVSPAEPAVKVEAKPVPIPEKLEVEAQPEPIQEKAVTAPPVQAAQEKSVEKVAPSPAEPEKRPADTAQAQQPKAADGPPRGKRKKRQKKQRGGKKSGDAGMS